MLLVDATSRQRRATALSKRGRDDGAGTDDVPGTDVALETASPMRIVLPGSEAAVVSVPTLAGALYAKVSAYEQISEHDNRAKHLQDAAQLLVAATVNDFQNPTKAMLKRLRWLSAALAADERGWQGIDRTDRQDATNRLARILAADAM